MITLSINKQYALLSACMTLGMLIGFTFFYSLWQWHNDWTITHTKLSGAISQIFKDNTTNITNALPNTHLFGQALASGSVPISNLQLRVTGIVMIENGENHPDSKAYISMAGQISKIYQRGDKIGYGVKIYDITKDAVILENDNHIEKLPLPREKLTFKAREPL
ncbi:MAG: hypothetical protein A3F42_04590 [Gammaproteobacteria bacterium RIFCSPHIGHO2_12_FULL_37_34]|nr:MAG: hypothetical protein A3F42_04590 [Gammaproteobacteria bacterium RIFCSPHIGHO2_12_FULL_37_34]